MPRFISPVALMAVAALAILCCVGILHANLFMDGRNEENFKLGMPDLAQTQNNCLPTSAANLLIWFGEHGFPDLLTFPVNSSSETDSVVHEIMVKTKADYKSGTPSDFICDGLAQVIHDKGYGCTITYRGPETKERFKPDWLAENEKPNKGFLLLFAYVKFVPNGSFYQTSSDLGHVVTLVAATPTGFLIKDPEHRETEHGGKLIIPKVDNHGQWRDPTGTLLGDPPLYLYDGDVLEAHPGTVAILAGAIRIEMLESPSDEPENPVSSQ